jgi:hypothetical protein
MVIEFTFAIFNLALVMSYSVVIVKLLKITFLFAYFGKYSHFDTSLLLELECWRKYLMTSNELVLSVSDF